MSKTVLILGASGKVGSHAAEAFSNAGWLVRRYNRQSGDVKVAAAGADVIVNGLNPPNYHDWDNNVPAITNLVLAAARSSGATVLLPGNVYVYGDQPGVWDASTPHRPNSRKGEIRARMEKRYHDAAWDGVQTILVRAGDFIDPKGEGTILSAVGLKSANKGVITSMGNATAHHAWAYLPDFARVMVALAEKRSELPAFNDIPFAGTNFSFSELADAVSRATGIDQKVKPFAWWQLRVLAPVWELARELLEMRYLWSLEHSLSDRKLKELLPDFVPTPADRVMLAELDQKLMSTQTSRWSEAAAA